MNELYNSGVVQILSSDAEVIRARLAEEGLVVRVASDLADLITELPSSAALVIAEDFVPAQGLAVLGEALIEHSADAPVLIPSGAIELVVVAVKSAVAARAMRVESFARLEESDRKKDEFLAMLGHELRNPLGAIQLALQVKQMQAPQRDKHTQVIERQLRNLGRIVDDLLDVSRVTLGKIALATEHVDLADSARRCVQALANDAASSQLTLLVEAPDDPVWVSGDPVRIEQVVANLVTNAIKYTPGGGEVTVTVEPDGRLTVEDTGIGLEPEVVEGLFDLFFQAKQGLDRSRGGLGLGLSLVRRLVELHGGTVGAHSDGIGKGSRFWFALPVIAARAPTAVEEELPRSRALRVLLVEDNDDARDMLRELLLVEGHDVVTATDGLEGLAAAREHAPDVLLVDIGLPRLDGHELAREVRRDTGPRPWLIAMTGYGQPADRERALAAGFDMFVVKPVSLLDLQHAMPPAES